MRENETTGGAPAWCHSNYDSKERFCSYWHQIQEILQLNPRRSAEIGIGNGFVSNYLKQRGINIITIDIDKRLNPHVVGSVLEIPFLEESFDVIACYEVLEHLPYEYFDKALSEIYRVSSSYVILSLPDTGSAVSCVSLLYLNFPTIKIIKKIIPLPTLKELTTSLARDHHWEIGRAGLSRDRITNVIKKVGFKIERTYRVYELPYHRLFVLKKMGGRS